MIHTAFRRRVSSVTPIESAQENFRNKCLFELHRHCLS